MKRIVLLLLTAAAMSAATITTPVLFPDSVTIGPSANIGAQVYAVPNSTWEVWFNDDWPGSFDNDYNDAVARVSFGVDLGNISYIYRVSANTDNKIWGGAGWLTLGQSSDFEVNTNGGEFPVYMQLSGHDNVQFVSGTDHAWVTQAFSETTTSETPEPGTFALVGAALMGVGFWRRKKRQSLSQKAS